VATGLLERDDELAQLRAAVDRLHRGEGAVVLVSGEAGVGKSSLVKAFLRTLDKRVRIRSGACEDLLSLRTLGPLRDAVRGQASPLADALASGDQDAVFAAVHDELSDPRQPTVLVVEDIHWADDATLDVLRFLGRRIAALNAVLLVTYSCFAIFVDQVPAAAQAARTARVSCGVACSGRGPRNLAAMMTRRSLMVMSS
jgi:predicted ATPase